jgi:predicted TIM-barrel fold metal-dependent hydrolase
MIASDHHAHAWPAAPIEAGSGVSNGVPGPTTLPPVAPTIEHLLDEMDANDIAQTLLIQPTASGMDHSYIIRAADDHRDRFSLCLLGWPEPSAIDVLEGLMIHPRVRSLRVVPRLRPDLDWYGREGTRIWSIAQSAGLDIDVLAGSEDLVRISSFVDAFPNVRVVFDHFGLPHVGEPPAGDWAALERLAHRPSVTVKISAVSALGVAPFPFVDVWDRMRRVVELFGPDRLVWGSDFPWLGGASCIAESLAASRLGLASVGLDASEIAGVIGMAASKPHEMEPA